MTSFLDNNSNILTCASYAAGMACGATVGYTLGASGDLLKNALITTSCGIAKAAAHVIFDNPLTKQLILTHNEHVTLIGHGLPAEIEQKVLEKDALHKKMNIFHILKKASLGFSHGIALGTGGASETLIGGLVSGGIIYAVGFYAEVLPVLALNKPLRMKFDESGKQIL